MVEANILVLDEPHIIERLKFFLQQWGYEMTGISKGDFIEDVIDRNQIDLLILAKEMRVSGPSLQDKNQLTFDEKLIKLKDTRVDFEYGIKLVERMKKAGIHLPVIYLTTDELEEPQWFPSKSGKLNSALLPKLHCDFEGLLKKAIVGCLEYFEG